MKASLCACLVVAMAGSALSACDDRHTTEVNERLVGTWVAESVEEGGTTRRVLTLRSDGTVKEIVRLVPAQGEPEEKLREGEWSFDGANFKRKYTYIDGKPLTNKYFIYETYEIESVTGSSLVASSKVGRGEIRLRRSH